MTPAWIGVDAATRYDLTAIVVNVPLVTDVDPDHIIDGTPAMPIHRLKAEVFTAEDEGSSRSMIERAAIRLRELCREYDVRGIAYDPYRFEPYPAEDLASEGLPVEAFPQSHARMVPASQDFFARVTDGYIRHDGDREFARHVTNAIAIETARGFRIDKSKSKHHIDAAVAAVMAVSIAEADLVGFGEDGPEDSPDVFTLT
jgi:phage terminase large subunit-like protein